MADAPAKSESHVKSDSARAADELLDSIFEEISAKVQAGQPVDVEAYVRRLPHQAEKIRKLFHAAQAMVLLGQSATGDRLAAAALEPGPPAAGQLGDFRILREIGRGGMGIVYEAEQISLRRRVALKVLPFAAVLDPRQLQRFKNEAQAAASLKHPNIVSIHAVGCDRGVHYYAMQYIEGHTLAEIIAELRRGDAGGGERGAGSREQGAGSGEQGAGGAGASSPLPRAGEGDDVAAGLPTEPPAPLAPDTAREPQAKISTGDSIRSREFFRSVADLGIQAAEALEHAHELGVVHRDIKPSNLMVQSSLPSPSGRGAGGEGLHLWVTDFGLAMIHAPSPLGGEGRGEGGSLTMTGDILGTLRYMSPEQVQGNRRVLDHHTDIYSLGVTLYELVALRPAFEAESREQLIAQVSNEEPPAPSRFNRAVPRDLETIILKAMAKDSRERYSTAQDMADDLRRFLEDKPIRARRPSLAARAAKWSRRHRAVVISAAVLLVVAVIGLATSTALIWREQRSTARALEQAHASDEEREAVNEFLQDFVLGAAVTDRSRGHKLTVEEAVDKAEEKIESAFRDKPRAEAAVRESLGATYMSLGRYADAERHLSKAYQIRLEHPRADDTDMLALTWLANSLTAQEKWDEARTLYERVLAERRRNLGEESPNTFAAMCNLASVIRDQGNLPEARKRFEELLAVERRVVGPEHDVTLLTMHNLAVLLMMQEDLEEARKVYQELVSVRRRVQGNEHPDTLLAMTNLAIVLRGLGRLDEARKLLEELLPVERRVLGVEHPETLSSLNWLGVVLCDQGEIGEGKKLFDEALAAQRRILGAEHPTTLWTMSNLATVLYEHGEQAEARSLLEELLPVERRVLGDEDPRTLKTMCDLGDLLSNQGKGDEGRRLLEEVLAMRGRLLGPQHPDTLESMNALAWLLANCPDPKFRDVPRAVELAGKTVRLAPSGGEYWNTLGTARYRAGDWTGAIEALRKSIELSSGGDGFDWVFLAMAHKQLGHDEEARQWYEKAIAWTAPNKHAFEEFGRFRAEAEARLKAPPAAKQVPTKPPAQEEEAQKP